MHPKASAVLEAIVTSGDGLTLGELKQSRPDVFADAGKTLLDLVKGGYLDKNGRNGDQATFTATHKGIEAIPVRHPPARSLGGVDWSKAPRKGASLWYYRQWVHALLACKGEHVKQATVKHVGIAMREHAKQVADPKAADFATTYVGLSKLGATLGINNYGEVQSRRHKLELGGWIADTGTTMRGCVVFQLLIPPCDCGVCGVERSYAEYQTSGGNRKRRLAWKGCNPSTAG